MKLFRKVVFWMHLVTGIAAGLVVLIMSVTGVLLTYERQMIAWADMRGMDGSAPTADARPLSSAALVVAASADAPGTATSIVWRASPDAPVTVAFGREGNRFLNAFTGEVLGDGSPETRAFFTSLRDWHRWLGRADDEGRPLARAITGASNLAFLFLVMSGFYLWWPRNWNPRALRNVTLFQGGLRAKARDFNWHNVIGFWSAVPLAIVVASAVVISYPWATALVYRAVGDNPPPPAGGRGGGPGGPGGAESDAPPTLAWLDRADALRLRAAEYEPRWRTVSVAIPASAEGPAVLTLDRGDGGQPHKRGQLSFDRASGEVTKWEPFSAGSPGRRLRSYLRFAHTGEVAGLLGQTLAGLVSAGAVLLVWTGFSLSLRRFGAWRARSGPAEARRILHPRTRTRVRERITR